MAKLSAALASMGCLCVFSANAHEHLINGAKHANEDMFSSGLLGFYKADDGAGTLTSSHENDSRSAKEYALGEDGAVIASAAVIRYLNRSLIIDRAFDERSTMNHHVERDIQKPGPSLEMSYYHLGDQNGGVFSYAGNSSTKTSLSFTRSNPGIYNPDAAIASYWFNQNGEYSKGFSVGYSWRDVKVERLAFETRNRDDQGLMNRGLPVLSSRSTRLSYKPTSDWVFQLSRGTLSGLDQLMPGSDVRRTMASATYNRPFKTGHWQTTLAWGRSAGKQRESMMGYLIESTLRFSGTHIVFGRLEQVGSDDLFIEKESLRRQLLKLNKVTLGYFQDVKPIGPISFDVGAMISRHLTPDTMSASFGGKPTSYMMFVRYKMQ